MEPVTFDDLLNDDKAREAKNILWAEAANDPLGWEAKLNTYNKARRGNETLVDAMMRVSSAYRGKSPQYRKAATQDFVTSEQPVWQNLGNTVDTFEPAPDWEYVHHENPELYESYEEMVKHLRKAWGDNVDFERGQQIGKEFYYPLKKNVQNRKKEIEEQQKALKNAGFDPGPVDGMMGEKTKTAIKGFQRAQGLKPDGIAGPKTKNKLLQFMKEINPFRMESAEAAPVTFDDLAPSDNNRTLGPVTFDDLKAPDNSQGGGAVTFDDLLPEQPAAISDQAQQGLQRLRDAQQYGTIERAQSIPTKIGRQIKRKTALATKALLSDIPFVRKVIPSGGFFKAPPLSETEKNMSGLIPFARDVGLYAASSGVVGAASKIPNVARAGQAMRAVKGGTLAAKTITEATKGALVGIATAGSEDPGEMAKKGSIYAAWSGGTVPLFAAGSVAAQKVAQKIPDLIRKPFFKVGESIGMVLKNNKATNLLHKRHADIMKGQIDSEAFIQYVDDVLTPAEKKLVPFLRERALPAWARKEILRNPAIRQRYKTHLKPLTAKVSDYLDEGHRFLMQNYGDDVGFIENYIPHIWNVPKNKQKQVVSWFITRNPHLKQRFIPTLKKGIDKFGLTPKYDDITDILRVYDQYKIKAVANLNFARELTKQADDSGVKMIQRIDKAPETWPTVDHPALRRAIGRYVGPEKQLLLSKVPVKVHPDIYESVNAIFSNPIRNEAINAAETLNAVSKYSNLSLSLFHHTALTEAAIAMQTGAMRYWNPVKIIRAFKTGKYREVFNNLKISKDAVEHGLDLGRITDVQGGNILINSLKNAEKNLRAIKGGLGTRGAAGLGIAATKIRKPLEFNNKFLWDYLHSGYKLNAYSKISADMLKQNPHLPANLIKREVAQFVNDTFGGQVWELLGKSPRWKQFAHFLLLSPDWTLSTMRQAMSPFGVGATHPLTRQLRAELGQDFWRRALIYFGGGMNILNYSMTKAYKGTGRFMWENPPGKETHLFIGYNPDGTEQYARWGKQFRELPEFINHPIKVIGRKMSPLARQLQSQFFPHPVWQKEFADAPFWEPEALVGRLKELGKMLLPYSIAQGQRSDFHPLGFAMPLSQGMRPYNARRYFMDAIKRGDKELVQRVMKASIDNGLEPIGLFRQAMTQVKSDRTLEVKRKAYQLFEKLDKIPTYKRKAEFDRMKANNELTPELLKQLKRIIELKSKVRQMQESVR